MSQTLGIIGCGQLAQMMGIAGRKLGVDVVFLKIKENSVVDDLGRVYDETELDAFLEHTDYVTVEREAIPDHIMQAVDRNAMLSPSYNSLKTLSRRHTQKALFDSLEIPTAPWVYVESKNNFTEALAEFSHYPVRAKQILGGYDGGGQWILDQNAPDSTIPESAYPLIFEAEIKYELEVSVLAARSKDGDIKVYPINHNYMDKGILLWSLMPADISPELCETARSYITKVMDLLDYAGVLAIEFFVYQNTLIANEIAPRVHNTGHWTIEGCTCDQFEQHVRAVMSLPLLEPNPVSAAAMYNILGDAMPQFLPKAPVRMYLHSYGKSYQPNRKRGHLTMIGPQREQVKQALIDIGVTSPSSNANA